MNTRYLWWWSFWIGLVSGLFCCIYALFPIIQQNIIWMSFVALPIFFGTSGAALKEFPSYVLCIICGVLWAVLMLFCMGKLALLGISGPLQMLIVVGFLTFICVGLHMVTLGNTLLNKVPMIFGGLAMTFAMSGLKGLAFNNLFNLFITMVGGLLMGIAISSGGKLMQKMKYFSNETPASKAEQVEAGK